MLYLNTLIDNFRIYKLEVANGQGSCVLISHYIALHCIALHYIADILKH